MHTLAQLASGELKGIKRLTITEELTEFPEAILTLADSLEVLDLSGNKLSQLPSDFSCLTKLKLLFLTGNEFEKVPAVIAACPQLEMISFKSNKLKTVATGSLPVQTRWLILTDNQITSLPEDIGSLTRLQKLALAGNKLSALPISMANCSNLELARLSANEFTQFPDWLFQLPKLAWLALAGNPLCADNKASLINAKSSEAMLSAPLADIQLGQVIGQGASGVIYSAKWLNQPQSLKGTAANIAVKLFKGEVTSDGYPSDELACCLQAGAQDNLIKVVAQIKDAGKLGLVMELIPSSFANLGLPPSLDTCTRDTFVKGQELSLEHVLLVLIQMAAAMTHLHQNSISHGDVYAHNTMINSQADMLFGDFGASSNLKQLPGLQQAAMESVEVRALACLIEDLLDNRLTQRTEQLEIVVRLRQLADDCLQTCPALRPRFSDILSQLNMLQSKLLTPESCSER